MAQAMSLTLLPINTTVVPSVLPCRGQEPFRESFTHGYHTSKLLLRQPHTQDYVNQTSQIRQYMQNVPAHSFSTYVFMLCTEVHHDALAC